MKSFDKFKDQALDVPPVQYVWSKLDDVTKVADFSPYFNVLFELKFDGSTDCIVNALEQKEVFQIDSLFVGVCRALLEVLEETKNIITVRFIEENEFSEKLKRFILNIFDSETSVSIDLDDRIIVSFEIVKSDTPFDMIRNEMPQIYGDRIEEFVQFLKDHNIEVSYGSICVNDLIHSQSELNMKKVKSKIDSFEKNDAILKPFMTDNENHIIDGHHQHLALYLKDPLQPVARYFINTSFREIIQYAKLFGKVEYSSIHESTLSEHDMKKFSEFKEGVSTDSVTKPKTNVDRVRDKQAKEKEADKENQERELAAARKRDFDQKEKEKEIERKRKESEKAQKSQ